MIKSYCDGCGKEIEFEEDDALECFEGKEFQAPGFIKNFGDESADDFDFEPPEFYSELCNECRKTLHAVVKISMGDLAKKEKS